MGAAQPAIRCRAAARFAYPAEGFPLYCDNAVVLRESGRTELAHQFINYLLLAPVAAAIVRASRTARANGAAQASLPEDLQRNTTLFPSEGTLARGQWIVRHATAAGQDLDGDQGGLDHPGVTESAAWYELRTSGPDSTWAKPIS